MKFLLYEKYYEPSRRSTSIDQCEDNAVFINFYIPGVGTDLWNRLPCLEFTHALT